MKQREKLRATWCKSESDIMLHYPSGTGTRTDGAYLSMVFDSQFVSQMKQRGYDITTMKFSIEPTTGNERFESERLMCNE